jgi:hypothetical protein
VLTDYAGWAGLDGVRANGDDARFLLTNEAANPRFPAPQATDAAPPAVVATRGSPRRRAPGGSAAPLPGGAVPVRVVGTIESLPVGTGDFVLGDEARCSSRMNAASPGTTTPNELWLADPSRSARSWTAPVRADRGLVARGAREPSPGRPLARGSLAALTRRGVVAFLLALVGSPVLLLGDARDDRRELFDLETQGAGPATLRRTPARCAPASSPRSACSEGWPPRRSSPCSPSTSSR